MKHVITFEEEDLLQYIKDMLAMRGVAPSEDIKIECEQIKIGMEETGNNDVPVYKTVHTVKVTCKEGPELTHCPMCKHSLVVVQEPEKPLTVELQHREAQASQEPPAPAEPVILDESLGESLEPPEPPTTTSGRRSHDEGGPSIASLRAQSERVRKEREPHLPKRPRGVRE